ncbi:hypothetical protein L1987_63542 [Smallanthus sonchifolius]|uniref:Uncharacterized protein n=1 Tax=Smallanthus sonchifolius TaxID=185202 RepID=A0ACB9CDH2_9ASTR|nr:hypothetical protein L1987_63542 [Smallanthus sonchifolius]
MGPPQFTDAEARRCLLAMSKRRILTSRSICWVVLDQLRVRGRMLENVAGARLVWRRAIEIIDDIYRELAYEFFSTYHLSCDGPSFQTPDAPLHSDWEGRIVECRLCSLVCACVCTHKWRRIVIMARYDWGKGRRHGSCNSNFGKEPTEVSMRSVLVTRLVQCYGLPREQGASTSCPLTRETTNTLLDETLLIKMDIIHRVNRRMQ